MDEKLRRLMKHEGINSTRLAEMLGIQASGISHIMSGRNNPSYDFLLKLLQRFPQINPDWLLLDKGPMYRDEIKNKNSAPKFEEPTTIEPIIETSAELTAKKLGPDNEDIIPARSSNPPVSEHFAPSSAIDRIVVFYKDKTFSEYQPK